MVLTVKILSRQIWWFFCDFVREQLRTQEFINGVPWSPIALFDVFRRWDREDVERKRQRQEWLAGQSQEDYELNIRIVVH